MYKLLKSFQTNETVEVAHLGGFFSPKINKLYEEGPLTVQKFFHFLSLFARDMNNIRQIAEDNRLTSCLGNPPEDVSMVDVFEAIDPEKRFLLFFDLYFDNGRIILSGWNHTDHILYPRALNRAPLLWNRETRTKADKAAAFGPVKKAVDEAYRNFLEFFRDNQQRNFHSFDGANRHHSRFFSNIVQWCGNKECILVYVQGTRDRTIRPSELAEYNLTRAADNEKSFSDYIKYTESGYITFANRTRIHKLFNYSSNVLNYFEPKRLEGEAETVPLCGVELEVSTNYEIPTLINACDEPFFICKSDASIRGNKNYMYELVTGPMSFLAQKVYWAQFFDELDYKKFDTSLDTTNGMHVHIDANYFKSKHQQNFMYFWVRPSNTEFFLRFSGRDTASFQRYSGVPKVGRGDTEANLYANATEFAMSLLDDAGRPLRGIVTKSKKGGTLEVRLFRGVVSFADMVKNLEMVEAALEFTKKAKNYTDLSIRGFLDFIFATPADQWRMLKEFLNTMDLDYCLHFAEIREVFIGETRIPQIAELIANAPFVIDDVHITCLNFHLNGNYFTYKNGIVQTKGLDLSKSVVSRFDTEVSSIYNKKKPIKNLRKLQQNPPENIRGHQGQVVYEGIPLDPFRPDAAPWQRPA